MKPRKNYRSRPKKTGAKKKQKVNAQKRTIRALGCEGENLEKMTTVEIREKLKQLKARKRGPASTVRSAKKKTAAKT